MSRHHGKPAGAQRTYGLVVGKIRDGFFEAGGQSPHYEIWVAANEENLRIAVNVESEDGSEVLVHYAPDYKSPSAKLDLAALAAGALGFSPLNTGPQGVGLDYLRDGLFSLDDMQPIPPVGHGVNLSNLLDGQIERAKADPDAVLIAFGEHFIDTKEDPYFHFYPGRGAHDVHMMQGNYPTDPPGGKDDHSGDNRVNGDGALFIRYAGGETIALFTRFSTQSISTDDETGYPK
ncbi:MAG TPA: DUF2278 family protein [Methylocystis sp.]|nr:DUF2278 family protein [Methylocystis sp.]